MKDERDYKREYSLLKENPERLEKKHKRDREWARQHSKDNPIIGIRLPFEMKQKLQSLADYKKTTLSDLLRDIISKYLDNESGGDFNG